MKPIYAIFADYDQINTVISENVSFFAFIDFLTVVYKYLIEGEALAI